MARKDDTELNTDDKFELLLEGLTAALTARQETGISAETIKDLLAGNAKAMQKAMKPENETHPGHSVFSHPEGDRARPKPPLPFQVFWNNYPIHKFAETETWAEWELYGQLQPGEFTVMRKDGTRQTIPVRAERNADGKVEKLLVEYPITPHEKWLEPPRVVTLYQMVHPDNPRKRFMEGMTLWLQETVGEEATV